MKPTYKHTLPALNKIVAHEIRSTIQIARGDGYFYLYSDDNYTGEMIASLPQTSIYVNRVADLSVEGWITAIQELLNH